MNVRRCINTVSIFLLLSKFQTWCAVTNFVAFQRLGALDGQTCPPEYANSSIKVFNRTKCLIQCAADSTCRGVFFEPETLSCMKCSAQFILLNDTSSTLSEFYKVQDMVFAYKLVEEWMQWAEAKQNCLNIGGQLTTIKSMEEQVFLANIAVINLDRGIWIGGNGTAGDEFSFEWLDGTSVSSGFVNWYRISNTSGSNCMKMSKNDNYEWKNAFCTQMRSSVCKIE